MLPAGQQNRRLGHIVAAFFVMLCENLGDGISATDALILRVTS